MKKGLKTLFAATVLTCASAAFAAAPVIGTIPDIRIGDQDPPEALQHTDANFFVFTNAFSFDDAATDADTPDANLVWSYDEGDNPEAVGDTTGGRWFQVNGFDSLHLGTTEMASADTTTDAPHLAPTNNLRSVSAFASFRDVILSPLSPGTLPFPDATTAQYTQHAQGKAVRFFVSDGSNVAHKDILVKSVDDTTDTVSGPGIVVFKDDKFDTQNPNWITFGLTFTISTNSILDWNGGAFRIRTLTLAANKYHSAGWWQNARPEWLPYSSIGSTKYVRGKFYVYAANDPSVPWSNLNDIPAFAMRLAHRFVYTTQQVVNAHDPTVVGTNELRASTDPTKPSIYRLDFDPIDTPYLNTWVNTTAPLLGDGIAAGFETWELTTTPRGYVCMTEYVAGTYDIAQLGTAKRSQSWQGDNLWITGSTLGGNGSQNIVNYNTSGATGDNGATSAVEAGQMITLTQNASGIALVGAAVPSSRVGSAYAEFYPGSNNVRMRVAENELYRVRFHLTSTQASASQSTFWLGARSIAYAYVTYVWMNGGTYASSGATSNLQLIPGLSCLNPDKISSETGGWYTLIQNTPMSLDIRADTAGTTLLDKMPNISGMAPQGDAATSRRDLRPTVNMWDSMTGLTEAGQVQVDRITVEAFTQIGD